MQNNETFHTTRVLAFFCFKWQRQRTTICWCRKTSKGIAATRRGRQLRHFNSRSFFRQNSAQTFAKWIKPAVKMLFCLRRQHRRRYTFSVLVSQKHPESLRIVIWHRKILLRSTWKQGVVIWDRKIVPTSVVWDRRYCLLTQNFSLTIIAWGRQYCHLRQKTTH